MTTRDSINDEIHVSDLTVGELRQVVRAEMQQAVYDLLWELEALLPDPDSGREVHPETARRLREYLEAKANGEHFTSLEDVKKELGLDA